MPGIGELTVERPDRLHEPLGVGGDRFGRIASLSFDGVDLYLTNPSPVEGKDARIAATCNRLIGVLVELRDAAEARQAGEAVAS